MYYRLRAAVVAGQPEALVQKTAKKTQPTKNAQRIKMMAVMVTLEEHDRYRDMAWSMRRTLSDIVREHLDSLCQKRGKKKTKS
jgi:hypothetical protein